MIVLHSLTPPLCPGQGGEGETDELSGGCGGDCGGPGAQLDRARGGDHRVAGPPHVPDTEPEEPA